VLNQFVAEADRKSEHAKRKLRETQEVLGEEAARKVNDDLRKTFLMKEICF
jgi:hypothetical protein